MEATQVILDTVPAHELFSVYPRQSSPQSVFVGLSLQTGKAWFATNAEIGNAVPEGVWNGRTRRYSLEYPPSDAYIAYLAEKLPPLLQRVFDDSEIAWDGNNHVGNLGDDALAAEDEIEELMRQQDDSDAYQWAEADDWLYETKSEARERLAGGATVDELEAEYQGDGSEDAPYLTGLDSWLSALEREIQDA